MHEQVADALFEAMKKYIVEFYGRDSRKTEYYGRVINQTAFERLEKLVAGEKTRVIHGGRADISERYIEPTILDFGSDMKKFEESDIMADEIFGPLLPSCRC